MARTRRASVDQRIATVFSRACPSGPVHMGTDSCRHGGAPGHAYGSGATHFTESLPIGDVVS
ncbi:hypothetical protein BURCENK562V_C0242 [Burkholderia cenocepacia K56-2Valvano]|nr:hypothetical protein BURCENK562V_C0242 [Burkholderia cenocepacia K56-2Valvano]